MEDEILKVYIALGIRPGQCLMHDFLVNTVRDSSEIKDEDDFLDLFKTTIRDLCDREILRLASMTGLSYFLTEEGFQLIRSKAL